jgi:hypothetical protein
LTAHAAHNSATRIAIIYQFDTPIRASAAINSAGSELTMTGWFQVYHSSANRQRGSASTPPQRGDAQETEDTSQGNVAATRHTQQEKIGQSGPPGGSQGSRAQQLADDKGKQNAKDSEQGDTKHNKDNGNKTRQQKKRLYEDEWQSTLYWL